MQDFSKKNYSIIINFKTAKQIEGDTIWDKECRNCQKLVKVSLLLNLKGRTNVFKFRIFRG
jgi:hypothetical protein